MVEVDGQFGAASGSLALNADHWLFAFGQPATGTATPLMMAAPDDAASIPYPSFYTQSSAYTANLSAPECVQTAGTIVYPQSWLGAFPLPPITGAPLAANVRRGVELKDYWGCCLDNPNATTGCGGDLHSAFVATLARAKRLGADHVVMTNYAPVVDITATPMQLDLARVQIPATEMAFIGQAAASAGLAVTCCCKCPTPTSRDMPFHKIQPPTSSPT